MGYKRDRPRTFHHRYHLVCTPDYRLGVGGKFVRTIGILRATSKIGTQNLAYNMRRLGVLERAAMVAT